MFVALGVVGWVWLVVCGVGCDWLFVALGVVGGFLWGFLGVGVYSEIITLHRLSLPQLYDLYYKPTADFNSGFNGCPREDALCGGGESGREERCGERGQCTARWDLQEAVCICHPGWRGGRCHKGD